MVDARAETRWLVVAYALASGVPVCLHHDLIVAVVVSSLVAAVLGVGFAVVPPRTRLPWLGLALPLFAMVEHVFGTPALVRVVWHQVWMVVGVAALILAERWDPPCNERRCSKLFLAKLLATTVVAFAAVSYKFWIFSDGMLSQDTAYFEQSIWGFVEGRNFFQGSSQAWWRSSPPLESHFAMHFSPVLFLVAGLYALWADFHLLQLLQVVAVVSSAVPIYLLVRRVDPVAALLFGAAYLVSPAVIYQTQLSFHVLSLASPVVAWGVYFFFQGRLLPYLGCLALACCVREDLALMALMGGIPALFYRNRRRQAWVLLPTLVGLLGGGAALLVTRTYCPEGNTVIRGLFSHLGATPREVIINVVSYPWHVARYLFEPASLLYLLGLFRPGLFAALCSPVTILVLPALAINLLARGAGTASLEMYYSVYIPPVLMAASVTVLLRLEATLAHWAGAPRTRARRAVAALVLVAGIVGLPTVFGPRQLAGYVPSDDVEDIRAILPMIPPEASVAAPRHVVYALAQREELYLVNRFAQYARYDPEYVLVETDLSHSTLNDGTLEAYRAYAKALATDPNFEPVVRKPHLILYRKRNLTDLQGRDSARLQGEDVGGGP